MRVHSCALLPGACLCVRPSVSPRLLRPWLYKPGAAAKRAPKATAETLTHMGACSCRVTEDVCAYPIGDKEAYDAVRSIALWRGENDDACVSLMPLCALSLFRLCLYLMLWRMFCMSKRAKQDQIENSPDWGLHVCVSAWPGCKVPRLHLWPVFPEMPISRDNSNLLGVMLQSPLSVLFKTMVSRGWRRKRSPNQVSFLRLLPADAMHACMGAHDVHACLCCKRACPF